MLSLFAIIGKFIARRYRWVLLISLAFIFIAGLASSRVEFAAGLETFLSKDSKVYQDYDRFSRNFGTDVVAVMVKGEGLGQILTPQNVHAMAAIEEEIEHREGVIAVQSPALFIRRAVGGGGGALGEIPNDPSAILEIVESPTGGVSEDFLPVLPDERHALVSIVLRGDLDSDAQKEVVKAVEKAVDEAGFAGVETIVTGEPAVSSKLQDLLGTTRTRMMLLAVFLLFVILALTFKVRGFFPWRWLPLAVVLVGLIYTAGIMGVSGVPFTMMTMSVFPIIIGLGIDYGIQFHNRYDEEVLKGESVEGAVVNSVVHIGPAVGIALISGCLGFLALMFSPIPMIRDFGLMLIIGVAASYIVGLFPLMAVLYRHGRKSAKASARKPRKQSAGPESEIGLVERILGRMAPWVIRYPMIIVPVAIGLTIGGIAVDSEIPTVTDQSTFVSQDLPVIQSLDELRSLVGGSTSFNVLIESEDVSDPAVLSWMADLESRLKAAHPGDISKTESLAGVLAQNNGGVLPASSEEARELLKSLPPSLWNNLVSPDFTAANLALTLPPSSDDVIETLSKDFNRILRENPSPSARATLTGFPEIRIHLVDAITGGRNKMTYIGIGFIFAGLLALFRLKVLRAILATLPILLIIGWAALFMYSTGIEFTPATATFGALIMGIGVEYTILLMSRYYEEQERGQEPAEAMRSAMTKIGRAICVSAFTTMGGFAALLIATDFPILIDFGLVTIVNVFFALATSLLVLPALLVWIDRRIGRSRVKRVA